MRLELPFTLVVVALILVDGCGARSEKTEASVSSLPSPGDQKSESATPRPREDLPLDIYIDAPDAPKELRLPSPPVAPGTPFPGSILDSILKGRSKDPP